ncbi:LysR family transcriptional regulator [Microvirga sp. W0021]|uniref:LysR family transcriptional regulator n=1 Tax=Hohaiivirga grylli TaxID=3133970 RepID=A0ABV0BGY0_9HYPH
MSKLSWDDFRLVKAVADAKGLVGASRQLKLNHSTVFRQLAQVEESLGVKLFERHRNGYVPTSAGQEMITLAERMEFDIFSFSRKLSDHEQALSGSLKITTNDMLQQSLILPLLPGYMAHYPDIHVELIQTNQALSLSKQDADIAIRATDAPPENLVGRRISPLSWAIYGHANNFKKLLSFDDLRAMQWIGFSDNLAGSKPARFMTDHVRPENIALNLNTVLGVSCAIENGIGIAALPCYLGDTHPALARLTQPLPELETSLWLLTHAELRNSARVRSFMDYFGTELSKQKNRLEGGL